jgi:1,2-diacylglycerol 3-beta-glucosyltransferase
VLLGQLIYVLAGLRLAQAPVSVYRALLYAPAFVVWKIWLYGRVWLGGKPRGWVRTARNEGGG